MCTEKKYLVIIVVIHKKKIFSLKMSTLFLSLLILFLVIFLLIIIIVIIYYSVNRNKQINSPCLSQTDCDPNLVCSINSISDLKTVCKSGLNQNCTTNDDCAFGLNCNSQSRCQAAGISPPPSALSNKYLSGGPSPLHRLATPKNAGWFGLLKNNNQASTAVSSVCTLVDNQLTCRPRVGNNLYSSPVIDVCGYSDFLIFLLKNGNFIVEEDDEKSYRVTSNISMKLIVNYRGYLYGLSSVGIIYYLPNEYLRKSHWIWKKDDHISCSQINHISASSDGQMLWIQNEDMGILYDHQFNIRTQMNDIEGIRILGRYEDEFLVLMDNNVHVFPGNKLIADVKYATFDDEGKILSVKINDDKFRKVVFANYKPYYIRI
jgi:hypothetical protein